MIRAIALSLLACSAPIGARTGLRVGDRDGGAGDFADGAPGPDASLPQDAGGDAAPEDPICDPTTQAVDLLFVIDNSGSMAEEQASLTQNLPALVLALSDPPDADGDGQPDQPAVRDLHIGVVSTDMGTGAFRGSCDDYVDGDDGVLQHEPSGRVAGCEKSYPTFLQHDADAPDPDLATDFECIATLGTDGCGYEQSLGALEKAIGVHADPGRPNDGFLRESALFAAVIVSDEDDCTAFDRRFFNWEKGLDCYENRDWLDAVDETVLAVLETKTDPSHVSVSAIVGVPVDLVSLTEADLASGDPQTAEDFDAVLFDDRMQFTWIEGRLQSSCQAAGIGSAYPPRRLVELVAGVDAAGGRGLVQSICQRDWSGVMAGISRVIPCP